MGVSGRVTGCAEVNEPLCGSSYPVYSLCPTRKRKKKLNDVISVSCARQVLPMCHDRDMLFLKGHSTFLLTP